MTMSSRTPTVPLLAMLTLSLACAAPTFSAEPKAPPTPTKEMRQKMAAAHEKMAACLRSETAFAECRAQMQKQCQQTMGEQECSMMMMGHGMGMKHD
jgi:hypothetical protein